MPDQPHVSVVLPLYNDAASIGDVLEALAVQDAAPTFEVIVVDDGSTDDGPDLVLPPARLIRQDNAGPAAARNRGAHAARGTLILFLDADCIPPPNWVAAMAGALKGRYEGVMGTLVAANDGIVPRLVQLEIEDRYQGMGAAADGVDFIAAPACGFDRATFLETGGFRESLRQAEDVEFAYRFTAAGHRIAFVDAAPVAHAHQTGWADFIATKYRRAVGRMQVFSLFPEKRRHDNWTPMSLKLQFATMALAVPALLVGLAAAPSALVIALLLLVANVALGWPLVRRTADRLAALIGYGPGLAVGMGFIMIRSLVILVAVLRVKLTRAPGGSDGGTA